MTTSFDRRKTLQELEQSDWGEPEFDSHLVKACHYLHRVPLCEFTIKDLRIMISQRFGLPFLVPIAVEQLEQNPLAEGDCYAGDLLNAVLGIQDSFWTKHPDICRGVRTIMVKAKRLLDSLNEVEAETIREILAKVPASLTEQ